MCMRMHMCMCMHMSCACACACACICHVHVHVHVHANAHVHAHAHAQSVTCACARSIYARLLTRVGTCKEGWKCSQMCQWALTRKRTLWGGGALERGYGASLKRLAQLGDLRLLEDGSERGGALISDGVVPQTVSEEQSGYGERAGRCLRALTQESEHSGAAAHLSLVIFVSLRMAASAEAPLSPMELCPRL